MIYFIEASFITKIDYCKFDGEYIYISFFNFLYSPFHQQFFKLSCKFITVLTLCIRYCVLISLFDLLILLCVHYCIDV